MSAKIYKRVLQGGLIASFVIVFFVFQDLLFPYITSKQLSFNILMEMLLAVWLVLILRYPEYRPRRNYIIGGLVAFLLAILASCAVSVDVGLSFWGDAERMLGLFHVLHFFVFYLILITVFRSWKEWQALLLSSVVVATAISLVGIFGPNVHNTIGNTTYVSGYLIFNIYFLFILFLRSTSKTGRWLYAVPLIPMLYEFALCRTSGAIIGLFISIVLLVFLFGLFNRKKLWRRTALLGSLVTVLIVAAIFSQQQSAWFQNSFLRNLTFAKSTFQTRLVSWRSGVYDFPNHWLFGTGFGNYAITFDKHFDSTFFNYSKSESYFDRAHNNLIDIASTSGTVGLLAYLSIFVAALYYLRLIFKRNGGYVAWDDAGGRRNLEVIVIVSLIAAYFIQNLVVFDSYVTYIGLMITLGLIYWQGVLPITEEEIAEKKYRLVLSRRWEGIFLVFVLLSAYLFASSYNLKPWRMFQGVIKGYSNIAVGNFATGVLEYQQALVPGIPLEHDGRVTLINLVISNSSALDKLPKAGAEAVLEYVISLAQDNVKENPQDSLTQLQLAQILDTAARFNYDDLTQFNEYSSQALQAMERSIAASPGRAPLYLARAQMLLFRSENEQAIQDVEYAISLNPEYSEPHCRLAQFYLLLQDNDKMAEPLNKCVDLGGVGDMSSTALVQKFTNYYIDQKDYPRVIKLAERLGQLNPSNAEVWFNLAKIYWLVGEHDRANQTAGTASVLDSEYNAEWQAFLEIVKDLPAVQ